MKILANDACFLILDCASTVLRLSSSVTNPFSTPGFDDVLFWQP
jgi:hypothetical protein